MNIFTFAQSSPSDTWTITHNLGTYPNVDVILDIDGVRQTVIPQEVLYVNPNVVTIKFAAPRTGSAVMAGSYSFKLSSSYVTPQGDNIA